MKEELEIAKNYVKAHNESKFKEVTKEVLITHKQTCQRTLEFLNENLIEDSDIVDLRNKKTRKIFINKMNNLEETIKLYEDNGI